MSRLDFAPKLKEIEVTDFKKGLGVFTPKPDKPVSFAALKASLKKAGYTLSTADITVAGTLAKDDKGWVIVLPGSEQRIALAGPNVDQVLAGTKSGDTIELSGDWKTVGTGPTAHEAVYPSAPKTASTFSPLFEKVSFTERSASNTAPLAPIRVTSPGLTVYKGGAVTPRFYFVKQTLGTLEVHRQIFDLSVSYTPTPRLQVEIEAPFSRTEYEDGASSGSGLGLGNVTAWAKYRFFRQVETYGDRQAAFRLGLELPTGKKTAPSQAKINVPAFVRQQLTPINGGLSPHIDVAFSQAGGRFIFGGNAEAIFRTEREGFRMGHEQRVNTDIEFVIPRDAQKPGGELFLILETTFVHRADGRLDGARVEGSGATEYYLAPGLQYAAHPRFVVEGSFQFPVVRNTGPLALRTDRNILLGVRYLF
ncbi:MAG TPA: hypothetical protein VFR78_10565 [Pyrinomonadaceae bacterium]|nr:hypothetical protein [Pyrinomonadaceae bacterium]